MMLVSIQQLNSGVSGFSYQRGHLDYVYQVHSHFRVSHFRIPCRFQFIFQKAGLIWLCGHWEYPPSRSEYGQRRKNNPDLIEMSGIVWGNFEQQNSSVCYVHEVGSKVIWSPPWQGIHSANKEASCSRFVWFGYITIFLQLRAHRQLVTYAACLLTFP